MSDPLGPMGLDALSLAAIQWLTWAALLVPALAITVVALVLRYRLARVSLRRYDSNGTGPWLDDRACIYGALLVDQSRRNVTLARYRVRKKSSSNVGPVSLATDVQVRLPDGRVARIAAGTHVSLEVGLSAKTAKKHTVATEGSGDNAMITVEVRAKEQCPVWLVAHAHLPADEGAMRSAANIELTAPDGIELHFARPEPPETHFLGVYSLVCLSVLAQLWFGFADGWRNALLLGQLAFAGLAVVSIKNTLAFHRALSTKAPQQR
jgi:hypothetical protein